jgi:hypothetical protein
MRPYVATHATARFLLPDGVDESSRWLEGGAADYSSLGDQAGSIPENIASGRLLGSANDDPPAYTAIDVGGNATKP